jgi:hypothetical protein
MITQLELFEDNDDFSLLEREIDNVIVRQDNLRKGIFARHYELAKLYLSQKKEIEELKQILQLKGVI